MAIPAPGEYCNDVKPEPSSGQKPRPKPLVGLNDSEELGEAKQAPKTPVKGQSTATASGSAGSAEKSGQPTVTKAAEQAVIAKPGSTGADTSSSHRGGPALIDTPKQPPVVPAVESLDNAASAEASEVRTKPLNGTATKPNVLVSGDPFQARSSNGSKEPSEAERSRAEAHRKQVAENTAELAKIRAGSEALKTARETTTAGPSIPREGASGGIAESAVSETQAELADFRRLTSGPRPSAAGAGNGNGNTAGSVAAKPPTTGIAENAPTSKHARASDQVGQSEDRPSKRARHDESAQPPTVGTSAAVPLPKSKDLPPPPRSALRPPRSAEDAANIPASAYQMQDLGNGITRATLEMEAQVVEVTETVPVGDHAGPSKPTIVQSRERFSTPLGMQSNIQFASSPDTVYATPNLPPPPRSLSNRLSVIDDFSASGGLPPMSTLAKSINTPVGAKRPSQPLTREQHEAKVIEGKDIVEQARTVYRRNIAELAERYGVSVGELHKGLDKVRKGAKGMNWDEVRDSLDGFFRYQPAA